MTNLDAALSKILAANNCLPVTDYEPVQRLPSGSMTLDWALGGGWARSRLNLLVGDPSFGKTLTAMLAAQYATANPEKMKNGGVVAYFDTEQTYDIDWADSMGIDRERLHLFQPANAESMQDSMVAMFESKAFDLIVVDSIARCIFNAEAAASAEDNIVGIAARKWHQFWRKATGPMHNSGTAVIFINQLTEKIGVQHGDTTAMFGGKSHMFEAATAVKMLKPEESKDETWITLRPKTFKNKTAPNRREAEVQVLTTAAGPFVNIIPELTAMGKQLGVFCREDGSKITGSGYWFFEGEQVAVGDKAVQQALLSDLDFRDRVENSIRAAIAGDRTKTIIQDAEVVETIEE